MSKQPIISAAEYQRLYGRNPVPRTRLESGKVKKGRPGASENVVVDSIKVILSEGPVVDIVGCRIVLAGIIPGLNGSNGLIREHFIARKRRKVEMAIRITKLRPPLFDGKVAITLKGYSSVLSDWENFCAKFKLIGDVLVDMGVLQNDSPAYIVKFIPEQEKCRRKDQRMDILIEKAI